ncbi:TetR family transcriptional regulator, partial [Actinoplanes sp. NPDC051633]
SSADPEVAVDLILGPLYWRLAVARGEISDDYLQKLTAAVMAALKAGPPAES